jgi:hypothetical protein
MNKLIQTIFLSAVICSPLSLLSLVESAAAHHTSSHVSTVATSIARRKTKRVRTGAKKRVRSGASKRTNTSNQQKKPVEPAADTQPDMGGVTTPEPIPSNPMGKPATPSNSKIKPIDPSIGNPTSNPGADIKLPNPGAGTPSVPVLTPGGIPNPAGDTPSIPRPNLPSIPKLTLPK